MAIFGDATGSGLGAARQAYLDKVMLENVTQKTVFDRLATIVKQLPLKNSRQITFDKWITDSDLYFSDNINADYTGNDVNAGEESLVMVKRDEYQNFVLPEGDSGTSKANMKIVQISTEVFAIGDWMPYTEELELFHDRFSTSSAIEQMSDKAALIIDGFYRDMYSYGAGHLIDITGDGSGSDNVKDDAFYRATRKITNALKLSGAEPVRAVLSASTKYGTVPVNARYIAYGHILAIDAMRDNENFVPVEKYADSVNVLPGEVGTMGYIRFIEDGNGYIEATGTSGEYIGEFVVCGKDHSAQVPVRGKGRIMTEIQPIGSGGTSDPLKRNGTVGWKAWLGAKVLYPERLGILKAKFNA